MPQMKRRKMSNYKFHYKIIPLILIVSIFFTSCDVPDISQFTAQSAEMTRGIRKGVNDTENLIKNASDRDDLFSATTRKELKQKLKKYRKALNPTLNALDGLDAYLDALNALSQANKKSGDNSKAVVDSVSNLVNVVTGFTFASEVINVASGVLTVLEQFRTAKSFKKRVNLASEIIEGKDTCNEAANNEIFRLSKQINDIVEPVFDNLTEDESNQLEALSPANKRTKLREWNKITQPQYNIIVASELTINGFDCGVIDLLKFNIADLKAINLVISDTMLTDVRIKNRVVLGYYESITATNRRIENESQAILNYKNLAALIREYEETGGSRASIRDSKIQLKTILDNLFIWDSQIQSDVVQRLDTCGANCGNMKQLVLFDLCDDCEVGALGIVDSIPKDKFDRSVGLIEAGLDARKIVLDQQNSKYLDDLKRIEPAHTAVKNEIKTIEENQNKLDSLLSSSLSALESWRETHANLKVAVNTKQTLSVSKLASKVREIWNIVSPAAELTKNN
jgi:hypothetical protein